jgi:hypothetical protein
MNPANSPSGFTQKQTFSTSEREIAPRESELHLSYQPLNAIDIEEVDAPVVVPPLGPAGEGARWVRAGDSERGSGSSGPQQGSAPSVSQPDQPAQHVDLHDAHDGAALAAPQFDSLPFNGRDDAAAAVDARDRPVLHDGHEGCEFVARILVHKCCGTTQPNIAARDFTPFNVTNRAFQKLILE